MPSVLNKKIHGIPEGAVYVGRPTKWGNPVKVGRLGGSTEAGSHFIAVQEYERYLQSRPDLVKATVKGLVDKDLVCWCEDWDGIGPAPWYCHAEILLRIANGRLVYTEEAGGGEARVV